MLILNKYAKKNAKINNNTDSVCTYTVWLYLLLLFSKEHHAWNYSRYRRNNGLTLRRAGRSERFWGNNGRNQWHWKYTCSRVLKNFTKTNVGAVITTTKRWRKGLFHKIYGQGNRTHIWDMDKNQWDKKGFSNTTIPKVYETLWNKSGDSFIVRYLDEGTEKHNKFLR